MERWQNRSKTLLFTTEKTNFRDLLKSGLWIKLILCIIKNIPNAGLNNKVVISPQFAVMYI